MDLFERIADYVVKNTQENASDLSNGLNYITSNADILSVFAQEIDEYVMDKVMEALCKREEIAEVELVVELVEGFDVVLYSNYAPNYNPELDEEEE